MARNKLWAGLDVGVEATSVCIIDAAGEILRQSTCPTVTRAVRHELAAFRRNRFQSVILEAGSGLHLARGLRSLGYPVELYETRKLSKFLRVRRNKTDAGDANGIAEAGRIGASVVSKVYLKDLESQCLQARLCVRRNLIRQRISTVNLIGRLFDQFGSRLPRTTIKGQLKRKAQQEIRRIFKDEPVLLTNDLRYLIEHYERLDEHEQEIDRILMAEAKQNEVCRRFMEIPGIGPICALNFLAVVGDPNRFQSAADIGSYLGLTPRLYQSGLTSRSGRISKMGNKPVRALLVQSAISFMRYSSPNSSLRTWALEVEGRRGKMRSRVALARKLAIVMVAMWKSGSRYDPLHCPTRHQISTETVLVSPGIA